METIQQQIGALQVIVAKQQVSVKRQRFAIIALAGVIVAGGFVAAVRPAGDATFDTITCKGWKVVDADGKMRIDAGTYADGGASVRWYDKDEKMRICAITKADKTAGLAWFDTENKLRLTAYSLDNGQAGLSCYDKDQKMRICASTLAGAVFLPTTDLEGIPPTAVLPKIRYSPKKP
jgi:hypothetical protein